MNEGLPTPSAFVVDGRPVSRAHFDRAALGPAHSVVIRACAGSGKTWLLVGRLLRLLLSGAEPGEILAITFTRKAAEEMRQRLLELLERLAVGAPGEALAILIERGLDEASAREALPRARGLFEKVLSASRTITIETFHGWFARIVRSAPLAAGVPAGFGLAERTSDLRDGAKRDFLALASREAHLLEPYEALVSRVGQHTAWELIWALLQHRNQWLAFLAERPIDVALADLARSWGIEAILQDPSSPDPLEEFLTDPGWIVELGELAAVLAEGSAREKDIAARAVGELGRVGDEGAFEAVRELVEKRGGGVIQPTRLAKEAARRRWGADAERRFALRLERAAEAMALARRRAQERDSFQLNRLVWLCADAVLGLYSAQKRGRGVLDFDDLEWMAYWLSEDEASAAYVQTRLDARYRHVLVDEFQDTNPLQWSTLKGWLEAYGRDGWRPSVFLVGDPNQSIYRFRGGEPRLFEEAREFLGESFGAHELGTYETRRCGKAIVAALNSVFEKSLGAALPVHQTRSPIQGRVFRIAVVPPQEGRASDREASSGVSLRLRDALKEDPEEPESLGPLEEARRVAGAIRQFVGRHRLEEAYPGDPKARVTAYRDILVLVRKRAGMLPLERAFRHAGIPYSSDRSGGLLTTLEALDLSALLRFLVVPYSDHLLAHVLRTPIFRAEDADLIRLALPETHGLTWWQRMKALPEDDPLAPAARQLARWMEAAGVLPVHDLLDRIYSEGSVIENYVATLDREVPNALREQVRSNLLAYLELALEMDSGRYPSLSRFIEELDALAEGSEQESPDEGTADRGDTVRIQTIHGSKGLEAPIVFLTDTAIADARTPANEVLIDWPPGASAPRHVSIYAAKRSWGSARLALFEQDALLRAKEDEHLLYVGMTRAKEILVVSGVLPARGEGESSWYARCAPFAELLPGPDGDGLDSDAEGLEGGTMSAPKGSEEIFIAAFQPAPQALGSHQVRPTVAAASEEADRARLFGIALHRVLEALAGQPPDPQRALALARAQRLDPNGRSANDLARLAVAILSEPSLKPFFDPSAWLRAHNEVEILTAEGRVVRIDRLVEFHNETWILDYKSAQSAGGIDPHRAQLELYRTVVQGLRPDVRVRAGVIFADAVLIEL